MQLADDEGAAVERECRARGVLALWIAIAVGDGAAIEEAKQDAAVVTDPASLAWLLNIRGSDVPFTPFALGFVVIHADAAVELFMDPRKLPEPTRAWLGNAVSVQPRGALPVAEDMCARHVCLPVHSDMRDDEVDQVLTAVAAVYDGLTRSPGSAAAGN